MTTPSAKALLIRLFVILAFFAGGGLSWLSARWLVHHDDIYLRWHETGFGLVTDAAEMVAWAGLELSLFAGLILGTIIQAYLPGYETRSQELE
jgi:hypothetical protein